MKTLIRILSNLFYTQKKKEVIHEEFLQEYKGRINIDKYVEMGSKSVHGSADYLFKTPYEVSEVLSHNTLFWIDEKNNLAGFSTCKRSLLVPLLEVNGVEIQNILPGKGPGEAYFLICLRNSKVLILSISPVVHDFDKYAEKITETMGFQVTFAPEFYNC